MEAIRIWIITQLFVYGCKEERMGIRRCENGHYYDDEKFFRCPYCGINIDLEDEIDSDQDKTVAIADINYSEDDDDRTIMAEGKEEKRYFVTGWLVCVDGAEKGRDYRLHMGFNRIGRSYQMDICLEDDLAITRDNHCSVIYDDKNGQFLVKPSVGTVTYLNGNYIYVFLTIFLYLLKCPQSLILSALRAFCFCGKPHISRSIFLYFRYQAWLKSW